MSNAAYSRPVVHSKELQTVWEPVYYEIDILFKPVSLNYLVVQGGHCQEFFLEHLEIDFEVYCVILMWLFLE